MGAWLPRRPRIKYKQTVDVLVEFGAQPTADESRMLVEEHDRHLMHDPSQLSLDNLLHATSVWKLDIGTHDFLRHFRDDYDVLLKLLSHGATGSVLEGQNLRDIAMDHQNVHTTLQGAFLRKHVAEARAALKAAEVAPSVSASSLVRYLDSMDESALARVQTDVPHASNMSPDGVRDSLRESVRRFFENLQQVAGAIIPCGGDAVALVYHRLLLELRDVEEATVSLFQTLLKAQNESGPNSPACGVGSIAFVVETLLGRVSLECENQGTDDMPVDLHSYLDMLEKIRKAESEPDILQVEAVSRLIEKCDRQRLKEIYEAIEDGDYYNWAENELRGVFFDALRHEFGHLLAKLHFREDENLPLNEDNDGFEHGPRVHMLHGMRDLLNVLVTIADLFMNAVTKPSEIIPDLLKPLFHEENLVLAA